MPRKSAIARQRYRDRDRERARKKRAAARQEQRRENWHPDIRERAHRAIDLIRTGEVEPIEALEFVTRPYLLERM